MNTRAAREQAQIAVELAEPDQAAVRALAVGIHRLADVIETLIDAGDEAGASVEVSGDGA
jgi:hypothetical protein